MKFGIVAFPGSNCNGDMAYIIEHQLNLKTVCLWYKDEDLQGADFVILPGGLTYANYLRPGAVAKLSPIMKTVIKHAERGGFILGISNGFQILTEAGLLDGALLMNDTQRFICDNMELKPVSKNSIITKSLDFDRTYTLPVAHRNGRYYAPDNTLKKLQDNDQILFRYASKEGIVDQTANPNGSIDNIAGIQNAKGNVLGIMPHPERAADSVLKNIDGKLLLDSILMNI